MTDTVKIVALSGSLRKHSLNTALLRELSAMAPEGVEIELLEYRDVPHYDADLGDVPEVEALKAKVEAADAVLISTPEYNYSIPGPLKNVIDWLSRPAYKSVFAHKPVGVLSVSPGPVGGARAQAHLKAVLLGMVAEVFSHPDVAVGSGNQRIVDGKIAQDDTRALLRGYLDKLAAFVRARRG